ncbi:hypothetical protein HNP47_000815 [Brevundimonas vesicularis]|uniref:Uncharacterized protein n=1 Tax=Brevundimonas vesicularis TaxID=41276 RepID=A0A7W9L4Z5_BREVE|nr:hypothetical protein [Brevundimonas vesicularis]MBB5770846.1 hypothetical protein [Brevundimonas vesicularis]
MFYVNSKGQDVVIADMAYPHLASAHAKLVREQRDGLRQAEIDAMAAELQRRDDAFAAEQAAQSEDAA